MRFLCAGLILAMGARSWGEDVVQLKNGDRLTGTVKALADGKLVLETTHSGVLKIDWAQVASVQTSVPLKLKLVDGELLEGKLSPGTNGRLKVDSAGTAGPVEVDPAKVKTINEPPTEWHGLVNAAGKITEGNTRTKSFLVSAEAKRTTQTDEILIRAIFHYGEQEGTLTERNAYGIGKVSYKFTPELYGYLSQELLSDTFKDIRLESITSVGAGYQVLKQANVEWAVEAGVAFFDFSYEGVPDESHLGARAASNLKVELPLGFEFKDLFIIYPNFKHSQEFELRNEASIGTAVGGGWTLLGGVITEYTNKPVLPTLKKTDDTYYLGLGYVF